MLAISATTDAIEHWALVTLATSEAEDASRVILVTPKSGTGVALQHVSAHIHLVASRPVPHTNHPRDHPPWRTKRATVHRDVGRCVLRTHVSARQPNSGRLRYLSEAQVTEIASFTGHTRPRATGGHGCSSL
jgi:hypothetical protein